MLQTRCKSVVLPALARPITRIRNWVYFARRLYGSRSLIVVIGALVKRVQETAWELERCSTTALFNTDSGDWLDLTDHQVYPREQ